MHRRLIISILILLTCQTGALAAEAVEITPFAGWRFGGDVTDFRTGQSYSIDSAGTFGVALDISFGEEDAQIEVFWSAQETEIQFQPRIGAPQRIGLRIDNILIGGLKEFGDGERVRPYIGGGVGAVRYSNDGPESDEWAFSLALAGGAKFFFGKHIGIRLEARLYGNFVQGTTGVACGNLSGCVLGFSGSVQVQGEGLAGLIFAF